MKLCVVLLVCTALCAADRRRSEDAAQQQRTQPRRHDDDERRQQHHHHDERRPHRYHDNGRRQPHDHDDDEDDFGHHHDHERRFRHLTEADGGSWRHAHEHDRHDRGRDGERTGRGKESRGGSHQERDRRSGDDRDFKKKHGKSGKKAHQGWESSSEAAAVSLTAAKDAAQEDAPRKEAAQEAGLHQTEPASHSLNADAVSEAEVPAAAPEELGWGEDEEAVDVIDPPPHEDVAAMARYIVHVSDWAAMATISTRAPTRGMPFANVFSVVDGTRYRSTGVPYLYLTDLEISVKDLRVSNNASLTMSLAQTSFCRRRGYDPEDPLCAHVILSGRVLQVDEADPEFAFARDALFARHPEMSGWPAGHHWFVAKLDVQNIIVLDYFGGAKTVPVPEYFATNPFKVERRWQNMM